ncbi:peroxide stress protein YaaA [Ruania suaedae]|uniref:YaaA family protein n=1 Tax=Ruania suaedae TaxID=2897774 RepID=UPI001E3E3D72|nr:peroxide stress protein YaaA [Ruania suaedae]UFU01676.1 peroxide stress protein YaaA [Ruania suaedae]
MLILLPPSEGKTPPPRGRPVDLTALARPDLRPHRIRALRELSEVSRAPDAHQRLGVGDSLAQEVRRNLDLAGAPAAPAAQVYTGVLYEAAGMAGLRGTARRRANACVRIVSALWGVLSPADRIPAYRLSMTAGLPGIGALAPYWSQALGPALTDDDPGVVIDCRSGPYVPAWRPPRELDWLAVRVVAERDGVRTVVSHHAKHARGVLTRHLLTRAPAPPRSVRGVRRAAEELVGSVLQEVTVLPGRGSGPDTLELVVPPARS